MGLELGLDTRAGWCGVGWKPKETNKHNSDGIGVSNMTLGTDFLVEKLRSKQYKMGIGNFKIGINLQIDKPESTDSREITDVFI